MAEQANPSGYGRKPGDGPSVKRETINARQAERLREFPFG